jgi:hypothetical protein
VFTNSWAAALASLPLPCFRALSRLSLTSPHRSCRSRRTTTLEPRPSNPRTLDPLSPRTLDPSNPRSLEPSIPRALEPSSPRALEPSSPRALDPPIPRSLEPSSPNVLLQNVSRRTPLGMVTLSEARVEGPHSPGRAISAPPPSKASFPPPRPRSSGLPSSRP